MTCSAMHSSDGFSPVACCVPIVPGRTDDSEILYMSCLKPRGVGGRGKGQIGDGYISRGEFHGGCVSGKTQQESKTGRGDLAVEE